MTDHDILISILAETVIDDVSKYIVDKLEQSKVFCQLQYTNDPHFCVSSDQQPEPYTSLKTRNATYDLENDTVEWHEDAIYVTNRAILTRIKDADYKHVKTETDITFDNITYAINAMIQSKNVTNHQSRIHTQVWELSHK
jgi:hypothetical protein